MVGPAPKRFLWSPSPGIHYVRRKGKYARIHAQPGTEEFDRIYWSILNGKAPAPRTSWAALVASYRTSDRWLALRTRTRADYELVLEYITGKNGDKDMTRAKRSDILAAMDANRHRVRFANAIPQVMSVLCEHAIDLGWRADNPAKGTRRLVVPVEKRKPHIPWPDDAVALWRAQARPLPRLIFELGVGSVQRPADWCRFRWDDYDGKALRVTQGKTGVSLTLPCTPELVAVLAPYWTPAIARTDAQILRNTLGQPLTYYAMAAIMLAERKRLGLVAYDLHALRYRGVMELAWAGCDDDEIAAYSGHASKAMVRKYAGDARQIMQARRAAEKRG